MQGVDREERGVFDRAAQDPWDGTLG